MARNFGATVAQILVNLNEGHAIEPDSQLHRDLKRTFETQTDAGRPALHWTVVERLPAQPHVQMVKYRCPNCRYLTGWTVEGGLGAQCGSCGKEAKLP